MNDSEYWSAHPPKQAIEIVKDVFGDFYLGEGNGQLSNRRFPVRLMLIRPCDLNLYEPAVRDQLDQIDWQILTLVPLDKNRCKAVRQQTSPSKIKRSCNIYGIAPIMKLGSPPVLAYHAIESRIAEICRQEGIKPSDGSNRYCDTKGKIHVCPTLNGERESAVYWATLLSEAMQLALADYSILEVALDAVPSARLHPDFHSTSGIIVDRINVIPPQSITREFRLVDGNWAEHQHE